MGLGEIRFTDHQTKENEKEYNAFQNSRLINLIIWMKEMIDFLVKYKYAKFTQESTEKVTRPIITSIRNRKDCYTHFHPCKCQKVS